jgi:molybdate transport system substrate-binding protein
VLGALSLAFAAPAAGARASALGPDLPRDRQPVFVFAAASLTDALFEIGAAWRAASRNEAVFNYGASSDLARQIVAGARADVFFSADEAQMDALVRDGRVRPSDRHALLSNSLVVIVPAASGARVAGAPDLAAFERIALADPETVPAGVYARSWLEAKGVWSEVEARVVPMLHVRAALSAVESENAAAGIVYRTDAARSKRVRVAFEVPAADGPRIVYPVAALGRSPARSSGPPAEPAPAAASFVAFLLSPTARVVFEKHGFVVLGGR